MQTKNYHHYSYLGRHARCVLFVVFWMFVGCVSVAAEEAPSSTPTIPQRLSRQILVIHSPSSDNSNYRSFLSEKSRVFRYSHFSCDFYHVTLDYTNPLKDSDIKKIFHPYLSNLSTGAYNAIIAVGDEAAVALVHLAPYIDVKTHVFFLGVSNFYDMEVFKAYSLSVFQMPAKAIGTFELAHQLYPERRKVIVISSPSERDRVSNFELKNYLALNHPEIELTIFTSNTIIEPEMILELHRMEKEGILIYLSWLYPQDERASEDAVRLLSDISQNVSIPLFVTNENALQFGVIGGDILSFDDCMFEGLTRLHRLFAHPNAPKDYFFYSMPSNLVLNYPMLEYFHIPTANIPERVTYINEPSSYWNTHQKEIMFAILIQLIIILFLTFTIALFIKLSRRDARKNAVFSTLPLRFYIVNREGYILQYEPCGDASPAERFVGKLVSIYDLFTENATQIKMLLESTFSTEKTMSLDYSINNELRTATCMRMPHALFNCDTVIFITQNTTALQTSRNKLVQALMESQTAQRTKSYFLSAVSNEILVPLKTIIDSVDLIQKRTTSSENQAELLEQLSQASHSLTYLLTNILDVARLESGQATLQSEKLNLIEFAHDLELLFRPKVHSQNLLFNMQVPIDLPSIYVDIARLRHVLNNVVGNAFKFTEKGSIDIQFEFVRNHEKEGTLYVHVTDSGIGMPPSLVRFILSPYAEDPDLGESTRKISRGLGLTLSRRLVEVMGGTLTIQSVEGKGSRFSLRLNHVRYEDKTPNIIPKVGEQ